MRLRMMIAVSPTASNPKGEGYCGWRRKKAADEVFVTMTPMMGVPLLTVVQLGEDRFVVVCKIKFVAEASQ